MEMPIIKEEIDIDDTMINLEIDQDSQSSRIPDAMEFSSCDELKIIEERPNMITVSLNDRKTEDERDFIDSLCELDQKQSYATLYHKICPLCLNIFTSENEFVQHQLLGPCSTRFKKEYKCNYCELTFESQLHLDSHEINHRLNKHFCRYGCGICYDTLELCLEHEYRDHDVTEQFKSCRLCNYSVDNMNYARMTKHMSTHFYMRRYVCALCRVHFDTSQKRKMHWMSSKTICNKVHYMEAINICSEMIAVSSFPNEYKQSTSSSEHTAKRSKLIGLLSDIEIKKEPIDIHDEQIVPSSAIKIEPVDNDEEQNISNFADKMTDKPALYEHKVCLKDSVANIPAIGTLRLPARKRFNTEKGKTADNVTSRATFPVVISKQQNVDTAPKQQISKFISPSDLKLIPTSTDNLNVLKVLSNNCMIVKLPATTKIIRVAKPLSNNSVSIQPSNSTSVSGESKNNNSNVVMPIRSVSTTETTLNSATQIELPIEPKRRNILLNNSTVRIIDSLPESRKIIEELQSQIRSIEKTLPLPGSVLHEPKRTIAEPISKSTKSNDCEAKIGLTSLELALKPENIEKLTNLSKIYTDYCFIWSCPFCPSLFKSYMKFVTHLMQKHNVAESKLHEITAVVKPYKLYASPNKQPVEVTEHRQLSPPPAQAALPSKPNIEPVKAVHDIVATKRNTQLKKLRPKPPTAESEPAKLPREAMPSLEPQQAHVPPKCEEEAPDTSAATNVPAQLSDLNKGPFECSDCQKTFTTKGALRIHKLIHTGELPHQCSYCDKRFRTRGQVRVHHRRHTGEKPFKCKVCSLTFTHRETLISHLSRHIGMKRYKCYGCDKYFVVVSGLSAHRQQRPDTCGKVKFTARAHGPRVRVIKGEVIFEPHPEHNGYLRSEDPLAILSEIKHPQAAEEAESAADS